jgi:hypothetical protein
MSTKGPFVVESFVTIGSFDYDCALFLILVLPHGLLEVNFIDLLKKTQFYQFHFMFCLLLQVLDLLFRLAQNFIENIM